MDGGGSPEWVNVLKWRKDELLRAGYDDEFANVLAGSKCDLHEACDLLKQGCPQLIAVQLMLDDD